MINFNINSLPSEILIIEILPQLHFTPCSAVNKHWKNLVDRTKYSQDMVDIKLARANYISTRYQINETKKKIENKNLFGRIVFELTNSQYTVLKIIRVIFYAFLPFFRAEVDHQKDLLKRLQNLENSLESLFQQYKKRHLELLLKEGKEILLDPFEGREEFEKLPILNLVKPPQSGDYIDYVRPEMLTNPIMRGRDLNGREFFTIRVKCSDYNYIFDPETKDRKFVFREFFKCETIFHRRLDSDFWISGGDQILPSGPYKILELNENTLKFITTLRSLIFHKKFERNGVTHYLV